MEKLKPRVIYSIAELLAQGYKIARLASNRNIDEKHVKKMKKSLKSEGQLIAAIVVPAKDCINEGLEVETWDKDENGKPIALTLENCEEYLVVLDGQNRLEAHFQLKKESTQEDPYDGDYYVMLSLNPNVKVSQQLSAINSVGKMWSGSDFCQAACMMVENPEEYPTLEFISELAKQGCSLPAASVWATMTEQITKSVLVDAMNGKSTNAVKLLKSTNGLERGKALYDAASNSFGKAMLQGRTLTSWIMAKYGECSDEDKPSFTKTMVGFFNSIKRKEAEEIEKLKGTRGGKTKESLVNEALDGKYKKYKASLN